MITFSLGALFECAILSHNYASKTSKRGGGLQLHGDIRGEFGIQFGVLKDRKPENQRMRRVLTFLQREQEQSIIFIPLYS